MDLTVRFERHAGLRRFHRSRDNTQKLRFLLHVEFDTSQTRTRLTFNISDSIWKREWKQGIEEERHIKNQIHVCFTMKHDGPCRLITCCLTSMWLPVMPMTCFVHVFVSSRCLWIHCLFNKSSYWTCNHSIPRLPQQIMTFWKFFRKEKLCQIQSTTNS